VKILEFKSKNKAGKEKVNGKMEIKNESKGSAELYFYGDICGSTWDKWQDEDKCPQDVADFLNQLEGNKDINIFINSGGGDAFAGLAIYNVLKRNTANKTVHVDGLAASAASVIALAGDKVIIPSTAQFMIHKAWGICIGNANDMAKYADDLNKCDESILNVYMENVKEGVEADTIKQMVNDSTWMTGEDAAKYFNVTVEKSAKAVAYVDSQFFSLYKNIPECIMQKVNKEPTNNADKPVEKDEEIEALIKRVNNELKYDNFEEE
jgi:ATP-dependent protease ClpP protease subunit